MHTNKYRTFRKELFSKAIWIKIKMICYILTLEKPVQFYLWPHTLNSDISNTEGSILFQHSCVAPFALFSNVKCNMHLRSSRWHGKRYSWYWGLYRTIYSFNPLPTVIASQLNFISLPSLILTAQLFISTWELLDLVCIVNCCKANIEVTSSTSHDTLYKTFKTYTNV